MDDTSIGKPRDRESLNYAMTVVVLNPLTYLPVLVYLSTLHTFSPFITLTNPPTSKPLSLTRNSLL
jgi:hypothetical protein